MDPAKIKTITDWPQPKCLRDIESFLGFANFYRRFIYSYSNLAALLVNLTKKDISREQTKKIQNAFNKLRSVFISDIVLLYYNPEQPIMVETDALDYVFAGIFF